MTQGTVAEKLSGIPGVTPVGSAGDGRNEHYPVSRPSLKRKSTHLLS